MNVTASTAETARCRCCRARVPADQIQPDGTCTGCSSIEAPRFAAVERDGRWTIEDGSNDEHVLHAARWAEQVARELADRLNAHPEYRVVWDWVGAEVSV